jgi:hypothetical protein
VSSGAAGAGRPAATPQPTVVAAGGAACAREVRDEFVRQQSLVYWAVYCPGELPAGFRLATADDPADAGLLGGDASPTKDDLNPGGGTFITRLVGPGGAALVLVQGAGADIYVRRDETQGPGGFEQPLRAAPFGDLEGDLFAKEPPAVVARDMLTYGHMVSGAGLDAEPVEKIAASMRPVDASGVRVALFSLADTGGGWVVAWPPDPTGEDVRNPAVCERAAEPGVRSAEAVTKFERESPPGSAPDAGGHGPFLQQAVVRFGDEGAASAYMDGVVALLDSCPKAWAGADSRADVNYMLVPEKVPEYGDQVVAFRRVTRSPVQGAAADLVLVRVGDAVSVLLYWQTVAAGADVPSFTVWWYARAAAEKLAGLAAPSSASSAGASPTVVVRPPAPPTGITEVDEVVRATLARDIDTLVALIGPRRVGCVESGELGSPPQCETGEAVGTLLDVFLVVGCDGGDVRLADGVRDIAQTMEPALDLYAVFRPLNSRADYRVVFAYSGVPDRNGFIFDVADGRITGLFFTCVTVVDQTRYVKEFLVWPPFGPHAQAPGHLKNDKVEWYFVPTPYNTFAVTGAFDHVIDEAGAADPFAWDVPGSSTYDGQDRWWRMYWHEGDVFDCAESCTKALTPSETSARLAALAIGDPVCVVGWTDDVGNVQAELVYLHAPERCPVPDGYFTR